jgi:cardiolipin synthase
MPQLDKPPFYRLIDTGDGVFPAMLAAIGAAQKTVRMEMYIFADDELGRQFLTVLVRAAQRGVKVRVLIDSFGSLTLPAGFWQPFQDAGGEVRWFNPIVLRRFGFRDHRKLLVCDEEVAFVGGFNITKQYSGDGVASGWRDIGLEIRTTPAAQLAAAFDEMFPLADFQHRRFTRLRRTPARRNVASGECQLLLSGPGRGRNPFDQALFQDLAHAKTVQIIVAYFLPTRRIRRALMRAARRGGRVQLILPGKSDVALSQLAGRSFYRRLLRAGVEIYEYQPQILHAKLMIVDGIVYVGSSNLDVRSLRINYELMLRFPKEQLAGEARGSFAQCLAHCERIELEKWRKSRTWWKRLRQRWAHFLLARVDPYVARWQYKRMQD